MQTIIQQIEPYVTTIVVAIIGLLTTVILGLIKKVQVKAESYFEANTTVKEREFVHQIASEAFSYAEAIYKEHSGDVKLNKAFVYASDKLGQKGIKITPDEIRAAIEKAWLDNKTINNNKAS